MSEHYNLFEHPEYYDIVFRRDVSAEVDFILAAYARFAGGVPRAVLELGCGPGYHARAFARRGFWAAGLDLRPQMLAFAAAEAGREDAPVRQWIEGDMRDFRAARPLDVICCMLNSFDSLVRDEEIVAHFRAVARNLAPRGLYVVELDHPRESSVLHYEPRRYAGARDGVEVEFLWPARAPELDLVQGMARRVEVDVRVNDHGEEHTLLDVCDERMPLPQDLRPLAALSGALDIAGFFGAFDLEQPLDDSPASVRMVVVFRKREA